MSGPQTGLGHARAPPPNLCVSQPPPATLQGERPEPGQGVTELEVEVALRHPGDVVLVQELALVAFLAQAPEPVLTHHQLLPMAVPEGTQLPWGRQSTPLGTPTHPPPGPSQPLDGIPQKGSGAQAPAASTRTLVEARTGGQRRHGRHAAVLPCAPAAAPLPKLLSAWSARVLFPPREVPPPRFTPLLAQGLPSAGPPAGVGPGTQSGLSRAC